MESTRIEVGEQEAGQRLDRALADRLAVSRARVRHLLEVGRIESGDRTLSLSDKSRVLARGECFEIHGTLQAADERPVPRPDQPLVIVAAGTGWLVVDKPARCGVHPLRPDQEDTVLNAVVARHPEMLGVGEGGLRSGVVHRLDVDTTGALVFATESRLWKRLRGAFSEHRVAKTYLALVVGRFEASRRVDVSMSVAQHRPARVKVVETGGTRCRQRVVPLRVFQDASLVEVRLETGFLHQIRASLAHLGHPILGDAEYGADAQRTRQAMGTDFAVSRPLLHAARLAVDEIDVEVAPPRDFQEALDALELVEGADSGDAEPLV